MGFYPMIDYVGGLKGVGDNLNGIFEDMRANKRQQILEDEQRSQAEYRALLGQKMKEEIADKQRTREAMAGFPAFLEANRGKLDYGTETRNVPDPETANEAYPGGTNKTFTTPPQETYGSLAGKYFAERDPEKGLKFLADESKRKDDMAKQQAEFGNKLMDKAIAAGDNDAANKMLDAWKQSENPYLKNMAGGIENIKIVGKDKMEFTVKKMMKEGELFDGSPAGEYDVVYETSMNNPAKPKMKSAKPAKKDDNEPNSVYESYRKGMLDKGITDEGKIAKKYMEEQSKRDPFGSYVKQMELERRDRDEERKNREEKERNADRRERNAKEELDLTNDPKNYEDAKGRPALNVRSTNRLKPEALKRRNLLRKNMGEPELEERKIEQDGKTIFQYVPKPISPQLNKGGAKTSKLSGVPTNVLLSLAKQRGLGGIA